MSKSILISAGEASGDLHAANLVKALHKIDNTIHVKAMGGDKLREAGADVMIDCTDIAVVGLFEVLINYRKIKAVLNRLADELKNNPPDLLILVDYQEFNFRLAKIAKQYGIKVLFYISPQVWAWRPHRVHKMGQHIDMMAVLFPFEEKFYKNADVPVSFVGHPLVDEVRANKSAETIRSEYQLNTDHPVIGLFPGSRKGEISRVLPIQLETAARLHQQRDQLQFILPIASTLNRNDIEPALTNYPELKIQLVEDSPYNIMQVCDAIITASGTATLEIALMGIPNVVTYRISPISYFILRRMVTIDSIGLANIVAEKNIIKEFIQHEAQPNAIADEINKIIDDANYRNTMINELKQLKAKLGKQGGSNNIAQLAYDMLQADR